MATTPMKLKYFFVFNPTFETSEQTEHLKLLFFWPPDVQNDTKMKAVGLSEALIKYSSTFATTSCEVVHTKKTHLVYLHPETDFHITMVVDLPTSTRQTKDGPETVHHEEQVQPIVLKAFLTQAYEMYKLFNGEFTYTLEGFNRDALVHKLDLFFPTYIQSLDFEHGDIVDAFNGIQFLPLDKNTYLRVQCFVNLTESQFRAIKYSAFVFSDHLVWSGLEQDDMRVLYKHLTQGNLKRPLSQSMDGARTNTESFFVTGPEDLTDPETSINTPRLFVSTTEEEEELHLVTYQCNEIKICLLVSGSAVRDVNFYRELQSFVSKPLQDLSRLIGEQQAKRNASHFEVQYKYLYFNHMNLAQKSSFMSLPKKSGMPVISTVSPDYVQYLTDMHTDFSGTSTAQDCEIILKTEGDCWVVGRQSDQRQFFVILNQKHANLIEINEEIRRLSQTHFGNIFFVD
eukprot:m.233390 g.233390  ORF g.233390 m.233390 type:complete len:456 (-) comp33640_c4_seq1:58-1425(-)